MFGFVTGLSVSGLRTGSAKCSTYSGMKSVVPASARSVSTVMMAVPKPPESAVLGIGEKIPGSFFLMMSVLALFLGGYSVSESNLLEPLTPNSVKPLYVLGSLLLPISWGCHVAAWIQFKNVSQANQPRLRVACMQPFKRVTGPCSPEICSLEESLPCFWFRDSG